MNIRKKTEVLDITICIETLRKKINLGEYQIKQVEEFSYLGSFISEKASYEKNLKKRIILTW